MCFWNIVKIVFSLFRPGSPARCWFMPGCRVQQGAGQYFSIANGYTIASKIMPKWFVCCTLCQLPAWLGLTNNKGQFIEIWEWLGTIYFPFVGKIVRVLTYYLVTSHVMMIHTTMTDLSFDCAEYCEKIIGRQKKSDEIEKKKTIWTQSALKVTLCIQ